jgi:hypothetical protein
LEGEFGASVQRDRLLEIRRRGWIDLVLFIHIPPEVDIFSVHDVFGKIQINDDPDFSLADTVIPFPIAGHFSEFDVNGLTLQFSDELFNLTD